MSRKWRKKKEKERGREDSRLLPLISANIIERKERRKGRGIILAFSIP